MRAILISLVALCACSSDPPPNPEPAPAPTPAPPPAPTCGMSFFPPDYHPFCEESLELGCCAEIRACANSPECVKLSDCIHACPVASGGRRSNECVTACGGGALQGDAGIGLLTWTAAGTCRKQGSAAPPPPPPGVNCAYP